MSKESYARGFCKAAAAAGVDPVALAKYAQASTGEPVRSDRSAGIGTLGQNEAKGSNAYIPQLWSMIGKPRRVENSKLTPGDLAFPASLSKPFAPSYRYPGIGPVQIKKFDDLTESDLSEIRKRQEDWLRQISPVAPGAPTETLLNSLRKYIRPENIESYRKTGVIPERNEMDTRGLEDLKLTPEQKEMIRIIQNSSARKGTASVRRGVVS